MSLFDVRVTSRALVFPSLSPPMSVTLHNDVVVECVEHLLAATTLAPRDPWDAIMLPPTVASFFLHYPPVSATFAAALTATPPPDDIFAVEHLLEAHGRDAPPLTRVRTEAGATAAPEPPHADLQYLRLVVEDRRLPAPEVCRCTAIVTLGAVHACLPVSVQEILPAADSSSDAIISPQAEEESCWRGATAKVLEESVSALAAVPAAPAATRPLVHGRRAVFRRRREATDAYAVDATVAWVTVSRFDNDEARWVELWRVPRSETVVTATIQRFYADPTLEVASDPDAIRFEGAKPIFPSD